MGAQGCGARIIKGFLMQFCQPGPKFSTILQLHCISSGSVPGMGFGGYVS